MDLWLFGKRLSGGLALICLLLIVVFVILRVGNSGADECVADKECVVYSTACCCGGYISINNYYLDFMDIQKKARCYFSKDVCEPTGCEAEPIEAYCENKICTIRNIKLPVVSQVNNSITTNNSNNSF